MAGDGFAVKTTIAQLGNVARSQLKSQGQATSNLLTKQLKQQDSRIEKVKETEDPQKAKPEEEKKRNKQGKNKGTNKTRAESPGDDAGQTESSAEGLDGLGLMVDLKA